MIVSSDNVDTFTPPDYGLEVVHPDETLEPSAAVDKKSSRRFTASATSELLCGVRDSAGAFGPLKFIARSLCFILDNCEV